MKSLNKSIPSVGATVPNALEFWAGRDVSVSILKSVSFRMDTNSICDEFTTTSRLSSLMPEIVIHSPGIVDEILPDYDWI